MRMSRTIMALGVVASLAFAPAAAMAADWGVGFGGFAGLGASGSASGASNWSSAQQFGSSTATAQSQSFGQAENGMGYGVGSLPTGAPASGAFGQFIGANVGSGSQSQAGTTANGNGSSFASTGGSGWGATGMGAIGGGGFVTLP